MKIEIITTPNANLKETGFGTITACNSIYDSIEKQGHSIRISVCKTKGDLDAVAKRNPDLVILAVKYVMTEGGEEIWLSEFFENDQINYSGSSRAVLEFDSSKTLAKKHLRNAGVKTAEYFLAFPGEYANQSDLPVQFPLFIKPPGAANGNGVDDASFVTDMSQYGKKIESLFDIYGVPALVEEYLDGREFTVAVFIDTTGSLIASPIEIVPPPSGPGLRILGERVKKDDSEELLRIDDTELKNVLNELAVSVFEKLGVRDYGRIDIKTDNSGLCYFMEANLVPGMTRGSSYFPRACEIASEIGYDRLIEVIVARCLDRSVLESTQSQMPLEIA